MNFPPGSNFPPITNVNNNIMITTNPANKKINLNNIIIGKDKRTTLMLRNIPNKYTLHNIVDENIQIIYTGEWHFMYLFR